MISQYSSEISAVANALAALATLFGFTFIILQISAAKRTLQITTFEHLYSRMQEIHTHFSTYPSLRKYFYDGARHNPNSEEFPRIQITCEMLADFFQQIILQLDIMPTKTANGWKAYIDSIVETSPILQEHFESHPSWYPSNLVNFKRKVEQEAAANP